MNAVIRGTGGYAPEKVLTNADFEKMVETSDEWIVSRTGIKERRVVSNGETNSDLCYKAAQRALEMANISPEDLDMIIVGTVTPDYFLPSTAAVVQEKLGAFNSAAFDVAAACAGFLHGLSIARGFILNGNVKRVLVIGSEVLSRITDYTDRSTCVLFGDGAGAVVVEADENGVEGGSGVLSSYLKADGSKTELLWIPIGGSKDPITQQNVDARGRYIMMSGNEIYKLAVRAMCDAAQKTLDQAGIGTDEISWLIPHQANIRIIEGVAKRLKIQDEKVYLNIEKYGNTSAASVPIALDEANRRGMLKKGDYILMVAFGGGLTWGASLVRW
ncbi:MAG: ketoacyl-ACP synthase III [candidate division Zixibacteria bacterium]|nr:ketoacyl-ACP synthase III [candidate division Zixibacteria bacterium]NIR63320.1 ketoacyl-ACP synthase III [candidate division Zixibacteria bacterium]NIS17315.1 ketoacyl-ACP synthase III [candidate division Zixibacteria bacterium]NIS45305.1 ketoacyl-ACP synthase III [candidate division Zixibacteria bacterium]NIT53675.1 ketoacyl-ACP synthase III [candidate division Zixibacteria bacterium]